MTTNRDDDALYWAGDDDPSLTPPIRGVAENGASVLPATSQPAIQVDPAFSGPAEHQPPTVLEQAETAEDAAVEAELARAEKATAQLSSVALITLGILGGFYLLYTVGWGVHVARSSLPLFPLDSVFLLIAYQVSQFLSVVAAPLWFVAALLFTQTRSWRSRIGWLLLGIFVLVPWPFILGA